jgi:hypothetical protein
MVPKPRKMVVATFGIILKKNVRGSISPWLCLNIELKKQANMNNFFHTLKVNENQISQNHHFRFFYANFFSVAGCIFFYRMLPPLVFDVTPSYVTYLVKFALLLEDFLI